MPPRALARIGLLTALACASLAAQEAGSGTAAHAGHGSHGGAIPGLKKELFEGITEADFMKLGDKPKTVKVVLVATLTDDNHGMNFNGYSKGGATWFIPVGWTVEVEFINPSPVPHSAIVIERADTKKLQVAEPWFAGGAVEKHLQGIALSKAGFTFTAGQQVLFGGGASDPETGAAAAGERTRGVACRAAGRRTVPTLIGS